MKIKNILTVCLALLLFAAAAVWAVSSRNQHESRNEEMQAAQRTVSWGPDSPEAAPDFAGKKLGIRIGVTEEERLDIASAMHRLGALYQEIYLCAERVPSAYPETGDDISQTDIDRIESILAENGCCVTNSDALYPEYLENSKELRQFWEQTKQGKDAETVVWSVSSRGTLYCRVFQNTDGTGSCMQASSEWDEESGLCLTSIEKKEILFWDMTENSFIYQNIYPDRHWAAAQLLRLQPVPHELDELTRRYILPIGYSNVNLFLLDWDSSDPGNLCFNDLFSEMYRMETGGYLYARDFMYSDEPFFHSIIPAELFEDVIYSHFSISLETFREKSMYDAESNSYPWQDLYCENILYYPELIPEVEKQTQNDDGTVSLLVNVICPDKHTDQLFKHEVTLDIEHDGSFRYLSNRIVYRSGNELPSPQARIPDQRFEITEAETNR